MNFGAFAGGFSGGFDNGVRQAKTIRDVIKERKLEDLRTQGMEEAQGARAAAVNGMITDNGEPAKAAPVDTAIEAGNPAAVEVSAIKPQATVQPDAGSVAANPTTATAAPVSAASTGMPAPPTQAKPAPTEPTATPSGRFTVGGKSYATREEAYKAADAAAPSTMDFFMKNAVPKIQEQYIANGDIEKAKAWDEWTKEHQSQKAMKEWSSMYRAAQFGDFEKAADHAFNLYKQYDDGITPVSKETVKDKDGNVTGFNVRLKNDNTGEVTSQFIDKKGLVEMGLSALAPNKMFEVAFKRQSDADTAAMNARIKANEKAQDFNMDMKKEEYKQGREDARTTNKEDRADAREIKKNQQKLSEITLTKQLDAENMGAKERSQAETKINLLKENGYTEEQITAMIPAIVGAGEHKKTTDPSERRALISADLIKNDPMFARATKEQQSAKVDQLMQVIYGGEQKPGSPANSDKPGKPAAIVDKPMAYDPKLPVKWNKTTGKPYHYVNGQYVPINGEVPAGQAAQPATQDKPTATGPAGGMPPPKPTAASAAAAARADAIMKADDEAEAAAKKYGVDSKEYMAADAKAMELRRSRGTNAAPAQPAKAASIEDQYNALRQSLVAMRKTEPADSALIKNAERQLSELEAKLLGGR